MGFLNFKGFWFDLAVFIFGLILIVQLVAAGQFGVLEGLGALLMAVMWAMFRFFRHDVPWKLVRWLALALWAVAIIGGVMA